MLERAREFGLNSASSMPSPPSAVEAGDTVLSTLPESRWTHLWAGQCCSKELLSWQCAPAACATPEGEFWTPPKSKGANRCNSATSVCPRYACHARLNFLSTCINNYHYTYCYNCWFGAVNMKPGWFKIFSFRNHLLTSPWLSLTSLTGPSSQRSLGSWTLPLGKLMDGEGEL